MHIEVVSARKIVRERLRRIHCPHQARISRVGLRGASSIEVRRLEVVKIRRANHLAGGEQGYEQKDRRKEANR